MSDSAIPEAGATAPAFTAPVFPGTKVKLSDYKGKKNVVLYFYPRDDTPGCTTEACGSRRTRSTGVTVSTFTGSAAVRKAR